MKKSYLVCVILIIIALAGMFCACGADDTSDSENVVIYGKEYAEADVNWHPFGETIESGEYLVYANDADKIFVNEPNDLISEGITYHCVDDEYPSLSDLEKVEKITLADENEETDVESEYTELFSKLAAFDEGVIGEKGEIKSEIAYINVYFKDYPAYFNNAMICRLENGSYGIAYCETEKNKAEIGENSAYEISDSTIISYIENL